MTENEAKVFIQNAMIQSKNVLAELLLIAPKVFAAKKKSLGEYYSNLENCKKEIESCEVAIKALEEVQQYRTIGTPEECRAAVEKQTAKRPRIMGNAMICPSCPRCFKSDNSAYCPSCGQRIDWGE